MYNIVTLSYDVLVYKKSFLCLFFKYIGTPVVITGVLAFLLYLYLSYKRPDVIKVFPF